MGVVVGLLFGAGLVSVWFSFVPARPPRPGRVTWRMRTRDTLVQAGVTGVAPGAFVGACLVLGLLVSVIAVVLTRAVPPAVAFGALAATVPVVAVRHRARTRRTALRAVWPQLIDDLVSGVRAGLSLPEALAAVGVLAHESGSLQDGDVLLHGGEGHVVGARELRDGRLAREGAAHDVAARRVGEGPEDPVHLVVGELRLCNHLVVR